ncbi:hypothetical protein SISSUDRAFT_1049427 [Sistotremastrum suecicum HHB10207 ss-3]|uniref:Secreted protein n=1 Tax=Sistotremastrum suecicum HHB10207 ss-3 TaxID=1314776 RepID=A0A166BV49_9AGAM|nr:hypothetical protein SISSUDRAFT_1049427 [Sistotremastrum suecicum HHB10207 ss-3]
MYRPLSTAIVSYLWLRRLLCVAYGLLFSDSDPFRYNCSLLELTLSSRLVSVCRVECLPTDDELGLFNSVLLTAIDCIERIGDISRML